MRAASWRERGGIRAGAWTSKGELHCEKKQEERKGKQEEPSYEK